MRRSTLLWVVSSVVRVAKLRTVFLLALALIVLTSCGRWGCADCDAPAWWPLEGTIGRFDVGDYKLYMSCSEPDYWRSGSPTVVYLHAFSVGGEVQRGRGTQLRSTIFWGTTIGCAATTGPMSARATTCLGSGRARARSGIFTGSWRRPGSSHPTSCSALPSAA